MPSGDRAGGQAFTGEVHQCPNRACDRVAAQAASDYEMPIRLFRPCGR